MLHEILSGEHPSSLKVQAAAAAETIEVAFRSFLDRYRQIARRAPGRFEGRDWHGIQADSTERLGLYYEVVHDALARLERQLGEQVRSIALWQQVRRVYGRRIEGEPGSELAETFYNSVNRRVFATRGVNPEVELTGLPDAAARTGGKPIYDRFFRETDTRELVERILRACPMRVPWRDLADDARLVAEVVDRHLGAELGGCSIDFIEIVRPLFFRNKGAYVVGRMKCGGATLPFVLALLHHEDGVSVDAVLLEEREVSVVFSFTRSYFLVDTDCPRDLIAFLRTLLPVKPIEELYIGLGFHQHGKRETYLRLMHHLEASGERFVVAEGERGMVMLAFTLPSHHVLFKVIRDRFDPPKTATRRQVMERYRLVFQHDRVGRLIDAQEFEELKFRRDQFCPQLLDELVREAAQSVSFEGDEVILHHLYTERKLVPLNLYLRAANEHACRHAVLDYGTAIKQLATADIFPGDFLLKNFGVTRHGRVVFYDYDELCRVTDCRFRRLPPPRDELDELSPEPWFGVAEHDIFPEEFARFLEFQGPLRELFLRHHGDLLEVALWQRFQNRLAAGELIDIYPYPQSRRLLRGGPGGG